MPEATPIDALYSVTELFPSLIVAIETGKYVDRGTVSIYPAKLSGESVSAVLSWVLTRTDWLPERLHWQWRGDVLIYAISLVRRNATAPSEQWMVN